jgi:integral membrane protein (TIGR01906 family)
MMQSTTVLASLRARIVPPITRPVDARGWAATALATLFGIALPLFLILGSTEYITKSDWLYSYNWWRNGIAERSGLPVSELDRGAEQIKDYFTNDEDLLDLRVNYQGEEVSLYKAREVLHMVDVKALMQDVFGTVRVTGLLMLVIGVAGWFYFRNRFWDVLFTTLRWSALGSGIVVGALAVAVLIDFNWVFTQFHFLSFANDLWQLNPRTDYLIIMFPQRFFFEATLIIAFLSVAHFAMLMVAVYLLRKRFGMRTRVSLPQA